MQIRSVIRQFIVSEMNCSQKYIMKKRDLLFMM